MDHINLMTIYSWEFKNEVVSCLQELEIIPRDGEIKCPRKYCDGYLKKIIDNTCDDGFGWICNGKKREPKQKPVRCAHRPSIRYKTLFYKSNLPLWKIVAFCHMWLENCTLNFIMKQISVCNRTAVAWSNFCRELVFDYYVLNSEKIGGEGRNIEIYEIKFGKRKHPRGHRVDGAWVFGGFERESGRVFMVVVQDRTIETLLANIEQFVEKGSVIYSDCWKSYAGLQEHPYYEHLQDDHLLQFKDCETGVYTNSFETFWRRSKASCPYENSENIFLGGYLARYMMTKQLKLTAQDPLIYFFQLVRWLYDSALHGEAMEMATVSISYIESNDDNYDDYDVYDVYSIHE